MTTVCFGFLVLLLVSAVSAEAFRSIFLKIKTAIVNVSVKSVKTSAGMFPFSIDGTNTTKNGTSMEWWQDLAPPFRQAGDWQDGDELFQEEDGSFSEYSEEEEVGAVPPDVTHFVFLVHGHRGFSKDLSYLQHVMQRASRREKRKRQPQQKQSQETSGEDDYSSTSLSLPGQGNEEPRQREYIGTSVNKALSNEDEKQHLQKGDKATVMPKSPSANQEQHKKDRRSIRHDMVVHATVCNERKTEDGVAAGGERLVEEMKDIIRKEMKRRQQKSAPIGELQDVTISMLGNSLGGLYSRYAIAKLAENCKPQHHASVLVKETPLSSQTEIVLDGRYRLHFNVFCTTATPHLGCAGNTFLPIPRRAEIGVARAMGSTGKDLFRLNDLMKDMCCKPEFLKPLAAFRKRIAYANAYGTDFPVPAQTAAFLSQKSSYPHHFRMENSQEEDRLVVDDNGLVIATLHTPQAPHHRSQNGADDVAVDNSFYVDQTEENELAQMSSSLDGLGWSKVFVDMRKQLPRISFPIGTDKEKENDNSISGNSSSMNSSSSLLGDDDDQEQRAQQNAGTSANSSATSSPIHLLKEERGDWVQSCDVAKAVTAPLFERSKFHWPVGHNMMVAFSRSRLATYMNKGGRPVVDSLAVTLVRDILAWENTEAPGKAIDQ